VQKLKCLEVKETFYRRSRLLKTRERGVLVLEVVCLSSRLVVLCRQSKKHQDPAWGRRTNERTKVKEAAKRNYLLRWLNANQRNII